MDSKIFKEYDIRGIYPQELDDVVAYKIGWAFVKSLKAKRVAVGRDKRDESAQIMPAFCRGVEAAGGQVLSLGICGTPELFFGVGWHGLDAGAIMTASHNPDGYTGIKLCNAQGLSLGLATGLAKVLKLAASAPEPERDFLNAFRPEKNHLAVLSDYYRYLLSLVDLKKIRKGHFKLVLDASGAAGDLSADYVFSRLPVVIEKINFGLDRRYRHGLNPMLSENQKAAKARVKKIKADLGLIWDGDADRCIFIDEKGEWVEPYYLNLLLAKIILGQNREMKIVADARLPVSIAETAKQAGGQAVISRAGTANILQVLQAKKIKFGCENSGHYFFNFLYNRRVNRNFVYGDAILPVLLVLAHLTDNKLTLSEAIEPLRLLNFISGEQNFPANFDRLAVKLKKKYNGNKMSEIDGLSVWTNDGFFNLRPSKTEPLVRLNIEAKSRSGVVKIKKELVGILDT